MNLDTERLYIRPVSLSDVDEIYEFLSNPKTMTYFVEGTYNKYQIEGMIEGNEKEPKHYAIIQKESNKLIGKATFSPWFMKDTYEIGWIMNSLFMNQGYMTEAAQAILDYGFHQLKLHRIVATCQPENISSKRICEKLGMRLEGTFLKCIHVQDDLWWDELFYAILQEEYKRE